MQTGRLPNRRAWLTAGLPPTPPPRSPPSYRREERTQRQHPNITDRPNTDTKTETETFLATATHQEEPSLSGKIIITRSISHTDMRLKSARWYQDAQLFLLLGEVGKFSYRTHTGPNVCLFCKNTLIRLICYCTKYDYFRYICYF